MTIIGFRFRQVHSSFATFMVAPNSTWTYYSKSYFSRTALPDLYTQVKVRVEAELGSIIYLSQPSFAF